MQTAQSPFAEILPRLYELKAAVPDATHPEAYFGPPFEKYLAKSKDGGIYRSIERTLAMLETEAWCDLKGRAALYLAVHEEGRGWNALFDTLNEAKGYIYLQHIGCVEIAFIKRAKQQKKKTPDLGAFHNGTRVLCEVKTINVSQDEVENRKRVAQGEIFATGVPNQLAAAFLQKVRSTLEHAVQQLDGEDPQRAARRIVFTILTFDDWVGHFQADYIAQLDEHLLASPVAGAELVFCPASNLFERSFTMRSASIVEI